MVPRLPRPGGSMINTLEERDRGAVRRDRYLCPTVIGRESELTTLRRLLETVRTNGGRTALIAGEAGIGKSRLVAETRSYAADNGFLVLDGACFPQDRETPYAPLLDLLRGRFAGLPTEAIAVAVGPFAAEIALLLPELGLSPSPAASVGDQALERRRLFAALTHCLITPARNQPVLVTVEDLHWCDDASLDLLFGLARQTAALPLQLVGTYRDDETDGRLRDWLMQLNRERLSTEIHLTPLGSEESSAMVRAISGTERVVPDELIDAVHARADGNPVYIEELLKSSLAVEGSCTDVRRCSPGPAAERSVPPNLQTMVLQRVERLSANAAEV